MTGPLARWLAGRRRAPQVAALPWRRAGQGLEVLLVTSRGTGRWIVPKGWPMKGRADHEAAAQEAFEEAGVRGHARLEPIGRYRYDKRLKDERLRPCRVAVYPLEVEQELEAWPEQAQRTRCWMSPAEAAALVAEPELKALLLGFRPG